MSGTYSVEQLRQVVSASLFRVSLVYGRRPGGDLEYRGHRPGPDWHAHGYFSRRLWMLYRGRLVRRRMWKARWLDPKAGRTCHSRPPDDVASLSCCTLIVVLCLWSWMDGEEGVHRCQALLEDFEDRPAPRTVQRWMSRAQPFAMRIQQAIRLAVIERSEPRPMERMFPGGLSPPERLVRRPWRDPLRVVQLWRGLALLLGGALGLQTPVAVLLAEARGRCGDQPEPRS